MEFVEIDVNPPQLLDFYFYFLFYLLLLTIIEFLFARDLFISYIMGSTTEFPRIKEVRTFIIDGVGSGGDYHNVRAQRC